MGMRIKCEECGKIMYGDGFDYVFMRISGREYNLCINCSVKNKDDYENF